MLLNFTLLPLEQVAPWGSPDEPGNRHLQWFGLTDGQYWMEVGDSTLFESSSQVQASHGVSRYCSYYVARLHEDILGMAPHVLEPVPPSLAPYISGDSGRAWEATARKWIEESTEQNENERCDVYVQTALWISARKLDNYYLIAPPNILFWSDESTVHIEWDNTNRKFDGQQPAWSATRGSYHLSRDDFIQEIHSFHERLMEQMRVRVKQVIAGLLPAEIKVDLSELKREHVRRERSLSDCFGLPQPATDWGRILEAIRQCEEHGV